MDCLPEISHACTANLQVRMAFAATGVPKRDTLSQSDPFLLVSKVRRQPVQARKKLGPGALGGEAGCACHQLQRLVQMLPRYPCCY